MDGSTKNFLIHVLFTIQWRTYIFVPEIRSACIFLNDSRGRTACPSIQFKFGIAAVDHIQKRVKKKTKWMRRLISTCECETLDLSWKSRLVVDRDCDTKWLDKLPSKSHWSWARSQNDRMFSDILRISSIFYRLVFFMQSFVQIKVEENRKLSLFLFAPPPPPSLPHFRHDHRWSSSLLLISILKSPSMYLTIRSIVERNWNKKIDLFCGILCHSFVFDVYVFCCCHRHWSHSSCVAPTQYMMLHLISFDLLGVLQSSALICCCRIESSGVAHRYHMQQKQFLNFSSKKTIFFFFIPLDVVRLI